MNTFQEHDAILQSPEAKRIIKSYNRLARVLLEFKVLYHRGWLRSVSVLHHNWTNSGALDFGPMPFCGL